MKKHLKRIVLVTRPKEVLGYYEYFIDVRKKRFTFLPSKELKSFEKALYNISEGKNPSGWILTEPSEDDIGIRIKPLSENCFYKWEDDLYFFPNDKIKNEWFEWHWKNYELLDDNEIAELHGIKVRKIIGTTYSD
jgi:hypothetical protein